MIRPLENIFERASRLSAAGQQAALREIKKIIARIEADEQAQHEAGEAAPSKESDSVSFEDIKHLMGILEGGPSDASTNKKYLEGLGESSLR